MMNQWNTTSYVGVTSNLERRNWQHKNKSTDGFTKKYNINKLVYYESVDSAEVAIMREKRIKKWTRKKKIDLIKSINSEFRDLSCDWKV